jgi:predicted enzyme related to lactoylglutathione lyase
MNCPECNGIMQKGEVASPQGWKIYWQPEEASNGLNRLKLTSASIKKSGGVVLANSQSSVHGARTAYHCEKCRKVIIEY